MPIDYDQLINWKIPEVEQQYTKRDTILYALGVGLGADPCDASQLKFVYEQNLQALPTMAIVTSPSGLWMLCETASQRRISGLGAGAMPKAASTSRSRPAS